MTQTSLLLAEGCFSQPDIQRRLEHLAAPVVAWCDRQPDPPVGVEVAAQQLINRLVVLTVRGAAGEDEPKA